jgi:hypothetical protein
MTKLSYLLAAAAVLAIATPTFAQDAPRAGGGATMNQGAAPSSGGAAASGEVKRDEGRSAEGRGDMRREGGDRDRGRMEARGERRDGDRGERREMRGGIRIGLGDRDRSERRFHRAHAHLLVIHRHHRHHRDF